MVVVGVLLRAVVVAVFFAAVEQLVVAAVLSAAMLVVMLVGVAVLLVATVAVALLAAIVLGHRGAGRHGCRVGRCWQSPPLGFSSRSLLAVVVVVLGARGRCWFSRRPQLPSS